MIQSFWGLWVGFSEVPIGRMTGGTLLARVTLPTTIMAGITMGQALRFLKQIGTLEDLGHNPPYMAVSITEVGNWEPCSGSVSTWTCIQCPQMSAFPWVLMVPNGRMVTFHMVWTCPWMSSRQNSLATGESGSTERVTPLQHP